MHLFRIHGSTGPHAAADLIVVEIMKQDGSYICYMQACAMCYLVCRT